MSGFAGRVQSVNATLYLFSKDLEGRSVLTGTFAMQPLRKEEQNVQGVSAFLLQVPRYSSAMTRHGISIDGRRFAWIQRAVSTRQHADQISLERFWRVMKAAA